MCMGWKLIWCPFSLPWGNERTTEKRIVDPPLNALTFQSRSNDRRKAPRLPRQRSNLSLAGSCTDRLRKYHSYCIYRYILWFTSLPHTTVAQLAHRPTERALSPVVNFNERITSYPSTLPCNIHSHKWTRGFVKSTVACRKQTTLLSLSQLLVFHVQS